MLHVKFHENMSFRKLVQKVSRVKEFPIIYQTLFADNVIKDLLKFCFNFVDAENFATKNISRQKFVSYFEARF